jgi:long-chain fatty acid transport protein
MGGAFCSIADDATAIFFNPAGMAFLRGTSMEMDALIVNGQFRFVPSDTPPGTVVPPKGYSGATQQPFIPLASIYLTHRLNERIALGFGLYTPNGLATNWTNFHDSDPYNGKYVGRFAGSRAGLQQYWVQPTVAVRLTKSQALSVGVAFVHTHLFLEESILNPLDKPDDFGRRLAEEIFPGTDPNAAFRSFSRLLPEGRLRAAAVGNKFGVAAGYLFKHKKSGTSIGLNYRSHVVTHLKGDAAFAFTKTGSILPFLSKDRTLETEFPNQGISATLVTPGTYVVGISNSRIWHGTLAVDFRLQDFHRFQDLPINFEKTHDSKGNEIGTPAERRINFNFVNSYMVQVGYEHEVTSPKGPARMRPMLKGVTLRAGYVYDRSPVPEKSIGPLFPDTNRHSWTAGMTKPLTKVDLSLFYQFMQFINTTTNVAANQYQFTNGEYRNFANLIGLGMQFHLGGRHAND